MGLFYYVGTVRASASMPEVFDLYCKKEPRSGGLSDRDPRWFLGNLENIIISLVIYHYLLLKIRTEYQEGATLIQLNLTEKAGYRA